MSDAFVIYRRQSVITADNIIVVCDIYIVYEVCVLLMSLMHKFISMKVMRWQCFNRLLKKIPMKVH